MSKPVVVIYTSRPISPENRDAITDYVDKQMESGKAILLDDRFTVKFYKAEEWASAVVAKNPHVY